jgi:hypothetical protein
MMAFGNKESEKSLMSTRQSGRQIVERARRAKEEFGHRRRKTAGLAVISRTQDSGRLGSLPHEQ